ncbi:metallophosphoesterase [Nocardioides sp. GCM10027113]|uniref:metallophosphoesterase n=1 Tax=unclassified Nocardioides TaxID=2615069 RepID=UPI00360EF714
MTRARVLHGVVLLVVWLVVALPAAMAFFLNSSTQVVVASHQAQLRPTLDGWVVLHTGPVLPDVRLESPSIVGADLVLGKTTAGDTTGLVERYAFLASQPDGQKAKVERALTDMAYDAAVRGALVGLVPVAIWLLVGPVRRRELWGHVKRPEGAALVAAALVAGVLVWEPWNPDEPTGEDEVGWAALQDYLGPEVPVPEPARGLQISTDATAVSSRRLIQSALDTYDKSRAFYEKAAEKAAELELRQPEEGETVVTLVSDRHDNIGMDVVARAIHDAAGASAVFNAGDDTSTGASWEAFSLDSVSAAFDGVDKYAVAGNHDHGDFVADYLDELGWTMLGGEVIDGPDGISLLGVDDPRSSGLGNWRDETGLSFTEVGSRLSGVACDRDEKISTILVHDENLADEALERGCVDLVLAGHVHVRVGPTRVVGANGEVGYRYTTGTTGGAAYAIAIGSKPRRDAMVSLVTYREGRPVGIQYVILQTNGVYQVGPFTELDLTPVSEIAPVDDPDDAGGPDGDGGEADGEGTGDTGDER